MFERLRILLSSKMNNGNNKKKKRANLPVLTIILFRHLPQTNVAPFRKGQGGIDQNIFGF